MKCRSCDDILNDKESTRKDIRGMFMDLCDSCYNPIKHDVDSEINPLFIYEDEMTDFNTGNTDEDY